MSWTLNGPQTGFAQALRASLSTAFTVGGLLVVWALALGVLALTAREYGDSVLSGL